jgi:hypothetical protein
LALRTCAADFLNDYVRHCRSRYNASVYLKQAEEVFDVVEDIVELISASDRIFSRLGAPVSRSFAQATNEGYRPRGEP